MSTLLRPAPLSSLAARALFALGVVVMAWPARAAPPSRSAAVGAPAEAARPPRSKPRDSAKSQKSTRPKVMLKHLRHLVLDPGHGGSNKGALGFRASREKALTLELSKVFKRWIEARSNVRVSLTRRHDVDLALRDRPRVANRMRGDALISVHCNASAKTSVYGMEVWFLTADSSMRVVHDLVRREEGVPDNGPEVAKRWSANGVIEKLRHAAAHRASQAFAIALRRGLIRARPGKRFRGIKQDAFGVLKEARMPAVVLEVGYITHPEESIELMQLRTQQALARGILLALIDLDRAMGVQRARQRKPTRPGAAKRARVPRPR